MRNFFRKVREYHRAYREGNSIGNDMKKIMKQYKSHRRVSEATADFTDL